MAGSVTEFVKRRAVPVDRFEIRLRWRDLHIVLRGDVERAATSDADVDPSGLDQGLNSWLDKAGLWRRASDGNLLRQALALRHVEDGEALQKCHGLGSSSASIARFFSSSGMKRSAYTTVVPCSPLRTLPPRLSAWRKVSQL